jgi:hypothetical protein
MIINRFRNENSIRVTDDDEAVMNTKEMQNKK